LFFIYNICKSSPLLVYCLGEEDLEVCCGVEYIAPASSRILFISLRRRSLCPISLSMLYTPCSSNAILALKGQYSHDLRNEKFDK